MKPIHYSFFYFLLVVVFIVNIQNTSAQVATAPAPAPFLVLDKGSIDNQFTSVLNSSSQYQDFKVIKQSWLYLLKSHINDTIKTLQKNLLLAKHTEAAKNLVIDSLHNELNKTLELFQTAKKEKDSMWILGIPFSKVAYNSLMWGLILGLLFLLILLGILHRKNNAVTIQTKQDLLDLKNEFEAHRKRALEREEKLSRKHLDDLNKFKK